MSSSPLWLNGELWVLVERFLSAQPATAPVAADLRRVLEQSGSQLLPKRHDWTGKAHDNTLAHIEAQIAAGDVSHGPVQGDALLRLILSLCKGLPRSPSCSLLGSGADASLIVASRQMHARRRRTPNVIDLLTNRALGLKFRPRPVESHAVAKGVTAQSASRSGESRLFEAPQTEARFFYEMCARNLHLKRRTYGHVDPTYCLLLDRTGQFVFTGADDYLVKCWRLSDARLIHTFRGSSAQISDITISYDNKLLAAGSCDKVIRVWCLLTAMPVAVLTKHTGDISAVSFSPLVGQYGERYLASTSRDGSVAFWRYQYNEHQVATFEEQPTRYHEKLRPGRSQLLCAGFSAGGNFYAVGSADHHVRVYQINNIEGPTRILEEEAHDDRVDSILWCNLPDIRFVSGSKDGTARIWTFRMQKWTSICLNMLSGDNREREQVLQGNNSAGTAGGTGGASRSSNSTSRSALTGQQAAGSGGSRSSPDIQVFMLAWTNDDAHVITASSDTTIKIWNSVTGTLIGQLRGHEHDIFVLEPHPIVPNILLSGAFDGYFIVWDLSTGKQLYKYRNVLDSPTRNIAVHDAKWSPDGLTICACDNEGHLLILGNGKNEFYENLPLDLFFDSDYNPLLRDQFHNVVDEQTQVPPHLLPPPFLIDRHRNPYSGKLQKLVPGREHMAEAEAAMPGAVEQNYFAANAVQHIAPPAAAPDAGANQAPNDYVLPAPAMEVGNEPQPDPSEEEPIAADHEDSNLSGTSNHVLTHRKILRNNIKKRQSMIDKCLSQAKYYSKTEHAIFNKESAENSTSYEHDYAATTVSKGVSRDRNRKLAKIHRNRLQEGRLSRQQLRESRRAQQEEEEEEEPEAPERQDEDTSDCSLDESDFTSAEETSEDDSDQHSDWGSDTGTNRLDSSETTTPPKAKDNKKKASSSSEKKRSAAQKCREKLLQTPSQLECYYPPPWLSEAMPKKTPYFPQMHDILMYFKQGHEKYFELVKTRNVYRLKMQEEDWFKRQGLEEVLQVKVEHIKYEIRPPRLAVLTLSILNKATGGPTGEQFTIKYHDMNDVVDFLVLHDTYKSCQGRQWKHGDRIRCMIDDCWWKGTVNRVVHHDANKRSPFLSIFCHWDNGEKENLSPWDIEGLDSETSEIPDGTSLTVDELKAAVNYTSLDEEWNDIGREVECRRISEALDTVMSLAISEAFNYPVDLTAYPNYMLDVAYPMDLSLIKSRIENRFYRRLAALKFDVEAIARNAARFNQPRSHIVKNSKIITKLLLQIIDDPQRDAKYVTPAYHRLQDAFTWSEEEEEEDDENEDEDEEGDDDSEEGEKDETERSGSRSHHSKKVRSSASDNSPPNPKRWKHDCSVLLQQMLHLPSSEPFRTPVSEIEYPDYNRKITTPMDLSTIKEYLMTGQYDSPMELKDDMMLIFQNSKEYNTDPKSEIRHLTKSLYEWFDGAFHQIVTDWRKTNRKLKFVKKSSPKKTASKKKASSGKGKGKGKGASNNIRSKGKSRTDDDTEEEDREEENDDDLEPESVSEGPSLRHKGKGIGKGASNRNRKARVQSSEEEDDESDEDSVNHQPTRTRGPPERIRTQSAASGTSTLGLRTSSRTPKPPARYRNDDYDVKEEEDEEELTTPQRSSSGRLNCGEPSEGLSSGERRSTRARKPLRHENYQYEDEKMAEHSSHTRESPRSPSKNKGQSSTTSCLKRSMQKDEEDSQSEDDDEEEAESSTKSEEDEDDMPLAQKQKSLKTKRGAKESPPSAQPAKKAKIESSNNKETEESDSSSSSSSSSSIDSSEDDDDKPLARPLAKKRSQPEPPQSEVEKQAVALRNSRSKRQKKESESEFEQSEDDEDESEDEEESLTMSDALEDESDENDFVVDDDDEDYNYGKRNSSRRKPEKRKRPQRRATLQPKANSSKRAAQALDSESEHTSARRPSRLSSSKRRRRPDDDDDDFEIEGNAWKSPSEGFNNHRRPKRAAASKRNGFKEDSDSDDEDFNERRRRERRTHQRPNPRIL